MNKTACSSHERLSKRTLLGLLPSKIDPDQVVDAVTKQPIDVRGLSLRTVQGNLNDGVWLPYEELLPRKILLYADDWTVKSFDPRSRVVCVELYLASGVRHLSIDVPFLAQH